MGEMTFRQLEALARTWEANHPLPRGEIVRSVYAGAHGWRVVCPQERPKEQTEARALAGMKPLPPLKPRRLSRAYECRSAAEEFCALVQRQGMTDAYVEQLHPDAAHT